MGHCVAIPKGVDKKILFEKFRANVVQAMEGEGAIEDTIQDLFREVRDRCPQESIPSAYLETSVMGVEQLCNVAGRAFGEMEQTKMTYPDWLSTLLKSFSVLGRNFSSKEAVLLDWSKGPGMAILVHSAVASDLTGTAVGVEGLRARAKKKGADVSDGGQDADGDGPDKDGDRDGAGGRMEWRRELELDMVGGIEERAGGLHLEAGEAKRTASQIHKGKLQLYLFTKVVDKALAWATGRRIARAVGYIYVESYGMDREEEVDGVRFVIRYRV